MASTKSDSDQYDPKEFRETLGSFGTTTKPGDNQLSALAAKVRQGVKHVELHLSGSGKGEFSTQDTPDKYGYEQRRTIMQLAKLNKQTLSVHGTFDITSLSGFSNQGFDESRRRSDIKEIDETIKFASQAAKGGAVVFHLQGENIPTSRSELNVSKKYLDYLKETNKEEYNKILSQYYSQNPLKRQFVDNPDREKEIREEYENLSSEKKKFYNERSKKTKNSAFEEYCIENYLKKQENSPNVNSLLVINDKVDTVQRQQEFIDTDYFKGKKNLNPQEAEVLEKLGIGINEPYDLINFQKATSIFTNGDAGELIRNYNNGKKEHEKITKEDFERLKEKLLVTYRGVLEEQNHIQSQADKNFFKRFTENQLEVSKLQKEYLRKLNEQYNSAQENLEKLSERYNSAREEFSNSSQLQKDLQEEESDKKKTIENLQRRIDNSQNEEEKRELEKEKEAEELIQKDIRTRTADLEQELNRKEDLKEKVQQLQMQLLHFPDSATDRAAQSEISQLNRQIVELEERKEKAESFTDTIFEKNTKAIAHLGIKALKYQMELKKDSKKAEEKLQKIDSELKNLQASLKKEEDTEKRNDISSQINEKQSERRKWVGKKDYKDIDLINRPLYLAPENMLPGYGTLSSLEEFKATIRMAQEDFAAKILSGEEEYKNIKEAYEKEIGFSIKTKQDALNLAKRHVSGTFDNAHAGAWFKHFRKKEGESEEVRAEKFNEWLNNEAEKMVKEGIVRHVHFNDTQGKDDDHNLLGQGFLDIHKLHQKLRKAGLREPLIVEAGGRGADSNLHLQNAFEIFNPSLTPQSGYRVKSFHQTLHSGVSDWISVRRGYEQRPQYSHYGLGYNTFRHVPPSEGSPKGDWSGTGFL